MEIRRISDITGEINTRELDVTQEQLDNYYVHDYHLQKAFPNLNASDREFIKTGITDEEWNRFMQEPEDPSIDNDTNVHLEQ